MRAPVPGLAVLVLSLGGATARASDPALKKVVIVQEGQSVPGVGNVTSIANLAVNRGAATLVEVDTDQANTDRDGALLLDALLRYQEGDLLTAPPGAGLDTFDTINLNNNGNSGWNFFLENTSGTGDDSGIYWNGTLLIQEGDLATAPQFSPNTPYLGFFECKINDAEQILVMASVDDPAVASGVDRALVVVDALTGTQSVFLKEGDPAPGLRGALISDFGTGPHNFDFNNAGQLLFFADTDAASSDDGVIYLDQTVLAQEGQPSPVSGRNWSSLSSPELSLNNDGDHVYSGSLDGDPASNLLMVKNGARFRQEGDTLPDIAPFTLTSFGSGPLLIADRGDAKDADPDVFWFGDWDDPDTTRDTGLFLNDVLLLQEGVDTVNGVVIDDFRGIQDGMALSDDGRYLLVEVVLVGGLEAAVLVDRGPWNNLGGGLAGAQGEPRLRASGSLQVGDALTMDLSHAPAQSPMFLVVGLNRLDAPLFGGTMVPSPDQLFFPFPTDVDGRVTLSATLPSHGPSGVPLYFQAWIPDGTAPKGFAASNGVRGVFP